MAELSLRSCRAGTAGGQAAALSFIIHSSGTCDLKNTQASMLNIKLQHLVTITYIRLGIKRRERPKIVPEIRDGDAVINI